MKPNPADPPLQVSPPYDINLRLKLKRVERQGYFIQVTGKKQTRRDEGTKMHILSFCVRQFNLRTAVILSHVHGKEDLSLFL